MRFALWLIGLFGVAVAIALFAGSNPGTVTVFWPPYRVDLSLNLMLVLLFGTFVTLHLALRALAALFALPDKAQQWRAQQRERAAHQAFLEALSHLGAGRFTRARRSARAVLVRPSAAREQNDDSPQVPSHDAARRCLSHWLLAESAHALRERIERDEQFALSLSLAAEPSLREGLLLCAARWELDDGSAEAALARLDALPAGAARRVLARRLRLRCSRRLGHPMAAIETARRLARHHALPGDHAQRLMQSLALEAVAAADDATQLQALFDRLPPSGRALPDIALRAAERLQALGGDAARARAWLLPVWEASMMAPGNGGFDADRLRLVRALVDTREAGVVAFEPGWRDRIEVARRRHPHDPLLRLLAGLSGLQQPQALPQATRMLESAVRELDDGALKRHAWRALAMLAEQRGESDAAALAYKRAAEA